MFSEGKFECQYGNLIVNTKLNATYKIWMSLENLSVERNFAECYESFQK